MDKLDLRADLESRVFQNKKKSELPKWLFFGALAISIVAGLTYLNKNKLATVFEGRGGEIVQLLKPYVRPEPVTQIIEYELPQRQVAAKPKEVTSQAIELWQPESKENERKKQTVFNDNNYVPKGAVNTMQPPTMTSRAKPQTRKAPTRYREWAPWYWDSVQSGRGGRKTRTSGRFAYDVIGSRIDTSSVCSNEKAGSLRYRDCRKGAKRFFQENCNSNKMFCLAGEMAP